MLKVIEVVREFANGSKSVLVEETCSRCGGEGVFAHLSHLNGGRCYKCDGTGVQTSMITIESNTQVEVVAPTTAKKAITNVSAQIDYTEYTKERNKQIHNERMSKVHQINEDLKRQKEARKRMETLKNDDDFLSLLD